MRKTRLSAGVKKPGGLGRASLPASSRYGQSRQAAAATLATRARATPIAIFVAFFMQPPDGYLPMARRPPEAILRPFGASWRIPAYADRAGCSAMPAVGRLRVALASRPQVELGNLCRPLFCRHRFVCCHDHGCLMEKSVEVTEVMIDAGFIVLKESYIADDLTEADRLLVEKIYRAMELNRSSSSEDGNNA